MLGQQELVTLHPLSRAKRMNAYMPPDQLASSTLAQSGTQAQGGKVPVTFRLCLLTDVLIAQTNVDIFSLRLFPGEADN